MTDTPYFSLSTPEEHGAWLTEKLLGIGEKVMELRKSPNHRYPMLKDDFYSSKHAENNASVSEQYALQAGAERAAKTVQVRDRFEGNAIICGRVSR